ncbi:MAG TPA: hypothetical protein DCS97_10475 [Planctomycetes bacterium]|nr:hypothetical protein [Planctomycetota bacterium]
MRGGAPWADLVFFLMTPFDHLLHHAPIAWRRWHSEAVAEAVRRDVPLAVLVGDALDAWTTTWLNALHADREVGELLETAFVPVAAERGDHPGLAALAQQVLGVVADASGVPCLLILLPGNPPAALGAIPYAPVRDAEQRKGVARVLLETATAWQQDPEALRTSAGELHRMLAGLPFVLAGDGRLNPERVLDLAEAQLMGEVHSLEGGFGSSADGAVALPRWPQPEKLRLLAALAARSDASPALLTHLERSLTALAAGGIRDQLGGGFHRASADADWHTPLYEQRLADQARLALAFLDGFALTGRPLYREIAERALAWAVQDLDLGDAHWGLGRHAIAGLGDEVRPGAFQNWSRSACAEVVGSEGAGILARRFALDDEAGPLAVRGELDEREMRRLPELVARLTTARAERSAPLLDERCDEGAHGLLLGALHAACTLPAPEPGLLAARDALRARLTATKPTGRAATRALVALGLAESGETAGATRWIAGLSCEAAAPCDDDGLVDPPPADAEDTVDGPGCAGALALALVALRRDGEARSVCTAHSGLLAKAPAVAPSLCLALARLQRE